MDVKLPNLGEGADSGSIVSLFVKEGDVITEGQSLLELENGKAVATIPSPVAGRVTRIAVAAGGKISVGQLILSVEPNGGAAAPAPAEGKKEAPPANRPAADTGAAKESRPQNIKPAANAGAKAGIPPAASPSLRKMARDLGIDLNRVHGSEEGGRIVLADVRAYIEQLQKSAEAPEESGQAPAKPAPPDFGRWGSILKKPMSPLRQTISRRMLESTSTIPQVTQFDQADITLLTEWRKKYAPAYEKEGARLTLTSFALKIVAAHLKKFPLFNSSLDEQHQEIIIKEYFHIGLAVDTEAGLMVPVIRDIDKKNLVQISKDITAVAEKARDRKITLEDMQGGTFTISNQGGIGGGFFTPIVNKPEAAILGLGRGSLQAMVKGQKIEPRLMLPICVSYDHRIIDGGQAARFTSELAQAFENFREEDVKI